MEVAESEFMQQLSRKGVRWLSLFSLSRTRLAVFAVALLVTLLPLPTPLIGVATAATVQPHTSTPIILVLGDSLSAGFGLEQDKGWVSLLQQQLQVKHYPHRVINASISGETTQGGASRIGQLLARYKPTIVLVELGGNDGLRGLPLDVIRTSLGNIIKTVRARAIHCVLIGMRLPPNYGPQYTQGFARLYQDLAKQYHVPLVPFLMQGFASNFQLIQGDGIHPTEAAQPLMLGNVWPILLPILESRHNH